MFQKKEFIIYLYREENIKYPRGEYNNQFSNIIYFPFKQ